MRPPVGAALVPVPIQEAVRDLLGDLLGRGIAADKTNPASIENDGGHVIASYVDDGGTISALLVADIYLAAATGAALAMVPAAALDDVKKTGTIDESLLDNFKEVANILAGLLNTPSTPHVSIQGIWLSSDPELPVETWIVTEMPTKRRTYAVTIEGYGTGNLDIIVR